MKRVHLCYAREYQDPEDGCDFFYSYSTIFRNVPIKHINTLEKFKDKIKKYCDKNFVESATNFNGHTKVYMVVSDATADGSNEATLTIEPPLRSSVASDETILYDNVPFTVRLANDVQEFSTSQNDIYRFEVDFIEAL